MGSNFLKTNTSRSVTGVQGYWHQYPIIATDFLAHDELAFLAPYPADSMDDVLIPLDETTVLLLQTR